MRDIINISLPTELAKLVRKEVKAGKYSSTSEFFREILRARLENRILSDLKRSQKDIVSDKGKVLNSLKDLR